jgi:hypothetical protein
MCGFFTTSRRRFNYIIDIILLLASLTRSVKVQVWGGQTDISEWVLRSCHHARSCARALAQQSARSVADVANVDVLANLNVVAADDGSKVVARLHHIEQGYELD